MKKIIIPILILLFCKTVHAGEKDKIKIAIEFLRTACVAGGEKVQIQAKGKAGFTLQKWKETGLTGEISFKKEEVKGLVDELNELSAAQASEARECMKPYIDKILNVILDTGLEQQNTNPAKKKVSSKPVNPKAEVEKLIGKWLAAWFKGKSQVLIDLTSEPFYLNNKILLTKEAILKAYQQLYTINAAIWENAQIQSIEVKTLEQVQKQNHNFSLEETLEKRNLTPNDYVVLVEVQTKEPKSSDGALIMTQQFVDTFKIVGVLD